MLFIKPLQRLNKQDIHIMEIFKLRKKSPDRHIYLMNNIVQLISIQLLSHEKVQADSEDIDAPYDLFPYFTHKQSVITPLPFKNIMCGGFKNILATLNI